MFRLPASRSFTDKQGQYLAFIHAYTRVMDRPPAEVDLQRHFGVTPPSVHGMVLSLERAGLIRREPSTQTRAKHYDRGRNQRFAAATAAPGQPVKITVTGY